MKTFVGHEKNFVHDTVFDREPMKFVQNWSDMVMIACTGDESGRSILQSLKL